MFTFSVCIYAREGGTPLRETLQSVYRHVQELIVAVPEDHPETMKTVHDFSAQVMPVSPGESSCNVLCKLFSRAKGDYLFWLEEGDFFRLTDLSKLRALRQMLQPGISAARIKCVFTADAPETVPHYRFETRILAKQARYTVSDDVHPALLVEETVAMFELSVTHRQTAPQNDAPNLSYYQGLLDQNGSLTPRERLFYARALRDSGNMQNTIRQYEALIDSSAPNHLRLSACLELAVCQSDPKRQFATLTRSFLLGPPQADICCMIGACLQKKNALPEAVFWYELALSQKPPLTPRTVYNDYWGYIPALQLCICHYALGNTTKAADYNREAGRYKPGDAAVQYNERFFADLSHSTKTNHW